MNRRSREAAAGTSGSSRRSLLKKGLAGGAILLIGGSLPVLFRSGVTRRPSRTPLLVLSAAEYATFAAAAARLCLGDGVEAGWPSSDGDRDGDRDGDGDGDGSNGGEPTQGMKGADCAGKVDALLARLHPGAAREFRQLLRVFENAMTGLFSIGSPRTFTASSPAEQDRRLESWRHSRLALCRSGYQAMKRLAHATYYASPESYAAVGYPGPPMVPQGPT